MANGVDVSISESGEILDAPDENQIVSSKLTDDKNGYRGYLLQWKGDEGAWFHADEGSYESLDAMM